MKQKFFDECEREALHLSGAIQPHGCLLICSELGRVLHLSENAEEFLGPQTLEWLGQPLPEILQGLFSRFTSGDAQRLSIERALDRALPLDVLMRRGVEGEISFEFLPHLEARFTRPPVALSASPGSAEALAQLEQRLVERIAELTGFQRTLLYQFFQDGDGEVIAEARDPSVYGSYLGLRFPASDVPQIARQLYINNPWRQIPDSAAAPVALRSLGTQPADLSRVDLRSVSPVHQVYLANMEVRASLSFPLVIGSDLRALVSCHHSVPRQLPPGVLEHAAECVRSHAIALASYQSGRRMRLIDGLVRRFDEVKAMLQRHGDLISAWEDLGPWLMREFRVDGATLCLGNQRIEAGISIGDQALEALDHWVCEVNREFAWECDSLNRIVPGFPLSEAAGALVLNVRHNDRRGPRIYLSRIEEVQEVAWGGNPDKPVEHHDGSLGIAPRNSFERWVEKRMGYCRPWENESRLLVLKLRELLLSEFKESSERSGRD